LIALFPVEYSVRHRVGKELFPAHAQEMTMAQHTKVRVSAVPAELLEGQDRQRLLREWLSGEW